MLSFFSDYAPHGYCLFWDPALVWTHVVSDALIAASYFSIPAALLIFLRRRPDIEFGGVATLFAVFILSCGFTHVLGIWNLWHGQYGIEGIAKLVTALASVPTAIMLWRLLPQALHLPSPSILHEKNAALAAALAERDAALAELTIEIEQRERAEAALVQSKKIEAIGQLTGGLAHDFNNLLQGIKGYIELIGMFPQQGENVRAWAENAGQAIDRGTKLTGQLLTFSRQQRLHAEPCIGAMLCGMDELLRNSVGPRIEVSIDASDDLGVVRTDRNQLELAVLNLAINSRDAMPDGGRLLVTAERRRDLVTISVTDDGSGMTDEIVCRAFEPFYTTKEPGRGTGLGLSTVYGLAQQAGGSVDIESKVGVGTTVRLTLPREEPDAPCPRNETQQSLPDGLPSSPFKILLVDDDEVVRSALANMMLALGHQVTQATSGKSALELLAEHRFDLLILDFAMPDMNGAELARVAIDWRTDQHVLFLTGYADSKALDHAIEKAVMGHARVLKKPIGATELACAIEGMLGTPARQDNDPCERNPVFV